MKNLKKFVASLLVTGMILGATIVEAKPATMMNSIDGPTIPPMSRMMKK